jgi:hypothetical protein
MCDPRTCPVLHFLRCIRICKSKAVDLVEGLNITIVNITIVVDCSSDFVNFFFHLSIYISLSLCSTF